MLRGDGRYGIEVRGMVVRGDRGEGGLVVWWYGRERGIAVVVGPVGAIG